MARITTYTVEGPWGFPFDMLRRDEAWPVDSVSAAQLSTEPNLPRRVTLRTYSTPNFERWESFGWRVVECDTARPFFLDQHR